VPSSHWLLGSIQITLIVLSFIELDGIRRQLKQLKWGPERPIFIPIVGLQWSG
jgi:hypothetical protein